MSGRGSRSTAQHYADFDVQVRAVLGPDRGGDGRSMTRRSFWNSSSSTG
jgi:hypothetical protein